MAPDGLTGRRDDVRILMVSPYPPSRDGIAAYAVQEVKRLRRAGHEVEVLSPGPSAAQHHLDLCGLRGVLALARRVDGYDRVIIQFHPDVFYPQLATASERAAITTALLVVFRRARALEVRTHEIDFDRGAASTLERLLWRSADRIVVHTGAERARFLEAFAVAPERVEVAEHGEHFERRTSLSKSEARALLGLPADEFVFLCIGFLQPHKGFDRAVRAFAGLAERGARLEIVGSVRVEEPEYVEHVEELRRLAAGTAGATLHEEYTSDERFDAWIVASDVVVLPYRLIWSSGVLERARLYDRSLIVSRTGGLGDQAPEDAVLVGDDHGLAQAMRDALGPVAPQPTEPWPGPDADRAAIQDEVRARAAAVRGGPVAPVDRPGTFPVATRSRTTAERSSPLRRVAHLMPPAPVSGRPGATGLKRLVRRLTAWEIDPIVHQVNKLRDASIESIEAEGSEADRPERG